MLDLLRLHDERSVNRVEGFADEVRQYEAAELRRGYLRLRSQAPKRLLPRQPYFVETHDGTIPIGRPGTCSEKSLARAIFNRGNDLRLPGGPVLSIVDYEFPLSVSNDNAVGEVDLIGIASGGDIWVIELKKSRGSSGDDIPLRGLFEALKYAAVIEANIAEIGAQANAVVGAARPNLLVAAPTNYWTGWLSKKAAGDWVVPMKQLAGDLGRALDADVRFVDLGSISCDIPPGTDVKPCLTGDLNPSEVRGLG